ncbi:RsiV family protein [Seleniivibrio woodruffii]|uniref:RsiV family protein n=1 Tax=Seleniivibrio woodruffii TaxID=1078050 RepID=UPI0026EE6DE2|nr:RsiV family protein [Seleniivibrio woodruffii]
MKIIRIAFAVFLVCLTALLFYLGGRYRITTVKYDAAEMNRRAGEKIFEDDADIKISAPVIKSLLHRKIFKEANSIPKEVIKPFVSKDTVYLSLSYDVMRADDRYVGILLRRSSYFRRAAHGDSSVTPVNIDIRNNRFVEFYDVFDKTKDPLPSVKSIIKNKIGNDCPLFDTLDSEGFVPRFVLKEGGIDFVFSKYEITPGYCDSFEVNIPYASLNGLLRAGFNL